MFELNPLPIIVTVDAATSPIVGIMRVTDARTTKETLCSEFDGNVENEPLTDIVETTCNQTLPSPDVHGGVWHDKNESFTALTAGPIL
mmetsp:Transcript_22368/g.61067  ORF Transcript_22368/g.61067 Transcript_22368/m.61067 type:complete len:88 (+) Transcript_22368:165-428(+)